MSRSILGLATKEQRPNLHFEITDPATGISYSPPPNTGWRYSKERMTRLIQEGKIIFPSRPTGRPREKKFRNELKDQYISFPSIIDDVFTAHGTAEIRELFGFQAFDFPKPVELIRRLLEQATSDDDIILDFFAGSATTANALFVQNQKDNQKRKFVLIQLPEQISKDSEIFNRGLSDVAEIGKERIRRVIAKMQAEREGQLNVHADEDMGFKVFRLERSLFKNWQPVEPTDPAQLDDLFAQYASPLVDGWQPQALLTEILLIEGFPLDSQVIPLAEAFPENIVWRIHHPDVKHDLFLCLDNALRPSTVDRLKSGDVLRSEDIFICLDSALTDEAKVVLDDRLRLKVI